MSTRQEELRIENYVPVGFKNRVSREYLCSRTGLRDRQVRKFIDDAADEGIIIINLGSGYFIPDENSSEDMAAVATYYEQERHRALSILKRNYEVKRFLYKDRKQMSVNIEGDFSYGI